MWPEKKYLIKPDIVYNFFKLLIWYYQDLISFQVICFYFWNRIKELLEFVNFMETSSVPDGTFTSLATIHSSNFWLLIRFQLIGLYEIWYGLVPPLRQFLPSSHSDVLIFSRSITSCFFLTYIINTVILCFHFQLNHLIIYLDLFCYGFSFKCFICFCKIFLQFAFLVSNNGKIACLSLLASLTFMSM